MRKYTALMAAAALLLLVSLAATALYMSIVSYGERSEEETYMSIVSYVERSEEETRRMFVEWKARHRKKYYSKGEEARRYALFKDNLRLVDQHNAAAAAGVYTYTYGLNYFSDLTMKEYGAICCGDRPSPRNQIKSGGGSIPGEMKHGWIRIWHFCLLLEVFWL